MVYYIQDKKTGRKIKMMKKLVMKKAWEIAKNGASRFGGKASEYLSESMKLAWFEVKRTRNTELKMVIIGNKDSGTYDVVRLHGTKVTGEDKGLNKEDYASVYCNFVERGFKIMDFFVVENGEKKFLGTKEFA